MPMPLVLLGYFSGAILDLGQQQDGGDGITVNSCHYGHPVGSGHSVKHLICNISSGSHNHVGETLIITI